MENKTGEGLSDFNGVVTLNNNERIFLMLGDMGKALICNIKDFERCYLSFSDRDALKIQHKWNGRFVRCSKKSIKDMLKAMQLNYKFL